ncbi:hypothetical protein Zmor_028157 [Zophobas morio]|uniref:Uncharacterized protein n=1 Tax=Zophobas morio TaxID=2755281 RepID=A0AA38HPV5_9CUCU|nr:hypothetical protein Zmor_028157 [Zophobas morio]
MDEGDKRRRGKGRTPKRTKDEKDAGQNTKDEGQITTKGTTGTKDERVEKQKGRRGLKERRGRKFRRIRMTERTKEERDE